MTIVVLELDEYTALATLAQAGATDVQQIPVHNLLAAINTKNSLTPYELWVQWQECDAPLPPGTLFPGNWPPEMRRHVVQWDLPISRSYVEQVVKENARNPVSVLVTPDHNATVGWATLDQFFRVGP